jgi:Uma2 family endonuclease
MTTANPVQPPTRRFTREEYHQMADMGFFQGQRVELIGGEIVEMAAQKDQHAFSVRLTAHALRPIFEPANTVMQQAPLRLPDSSEPEPDVAVAPGNVRQVSTHPVTALLIVEVADTTLAFDRGNKASLYARAGIADYWIVNLVDRRVEILRNPAPDPAAKFGWSYAAPTTHPPGESITPLAAPAASIPVADLLP